MSPLRLALAVLVAVAAVTAVTSLAWAAFTDQKTSPQTLQAASTWPMMLHMTSGSYTGNGKTQALKVTKWKPDLVIIRGDTNQPAVARTSPMTGDVSKPLIGGAALNNSMITSLDANGFSIGSDNKVNNAGVLYHWVAMEAGPGTLTVGSYAGNGALTRAITGAGFSPEYVAVMDAGNARAVQRYAGMLRSYQFDGDTGIPSLRIATLDSDGFTVGNSSETNRAGNTYYWFAFNTSPGSVDIGSYTGDGADNRAVGGLGFQPSYLAVKADNTVTARAGAQRFSSQNGDISFVFSTNPPVPNVIQNYNADGFQVGSDVTVNQSLIKHFHLALRNTASACQQEGTYSITSPADSFIDQGNVTQNNGTNNALRVRTRLNANRRALIRHTLPELDPDCVISSAKLVLTTTNDKLGRTLHAIRIAAPWSESTVNWSNQPATTGTPAGAPSAANGQPVAFDVTAPVQDMFAGTTANNGFLVKDATEDDPGGVENIYASNESGGADPQLILVIAPP